MVSGGPRPARRAAQGGRGGRPTLEAVAARAGVGRGTVSRVINDSPQVTEATRALVERAIAELGYVPNRTARALAANRNDAIALVVPEPESRFFAQPYFSEMLHGVGQALDSTRMQLLLTFAGSDRERSRLAQYLGAHRVDGVLLVGVHGDDPLPEQLQELRLPTVISGRRHADEPLPSVDTDNFEAARTAVAHLAARGRRRIATITGLLDVYGAQRRLDGYRTALEEAGLAPAEELVAAGDFTEERAAGAMAELLRRRPDLDAVFAASDPTAAGARQVLREHGRRVPDDVALVGFDDSVIARHLDPPLTSMRQPMAEMGREMVRVLLEEVGQPAAEPPRVVLPSELVIRESS